MPSEWLNRAGLALDCASGFLLAPELIGKRRLEMLERHIEQAFTSLVKDLKEVEQIYHDWRKDPHHIPWPRRFPILGRLISKRLGKRYYPPSPLHIAIWISTALMIFILADKLFVYLLGSNPVIDLFISRYPVDYTFTDSLKYVLLAFGWTVFGTISAYGLEFWLLWFSKLLVAKLHGADKLREILLALGIMCLILGFLLQLLSTF